MKLRVQGLMDHIRKARGVPAKVKGAIPETVLSEDDRAISFRIGDKVAVRYYNPRIKDASVPADGEVLGEAPTGAVEERIIGPYLGKQVFVLSDKDTQIPRTPTGDVITIDASELNRPKSGDVHAHDLKKGLLRSYRKMLENGKLRKLGPEDPLMVFLLGLESRIGQELSVYILDGDAFGELSEKYRGIADGMVSHSAFFGRVPERAGGRYNIFVPEPVYKGLLYLTGLKEDLKEADIILSLWGYNELEHLEGGAGKRGELSAKKTKDAVRLIFLLSMAKYHLEKGRKEKAFRFCRKASEVAEEWNIYNDLFSYVYQQKGMPDKAFDARLKIIADACLSRGSLEGGERFLEHVFEVMNGWLRPKQVKKLIEMKLAYLVSEKLPEKGMKVLKRTGNFAGLNTARRDFIYESAVFVPVIIKYMEDEISARGGKSASRKSGLSQHDAMIIESLSQLIKKSPLSEDPSRESLWADIVRRAGALCGRVYFSAGRYKKAAEALYLACEYGSRDEEIFVLFIKSAIEADQSPGNINRCRRIAEIATDIFGDTQEWKELKAWLRGMLSDINGHIKNAGEKLDNGEYREVLSAAASFREMFNGSGMPERLSEARDTARRIMKLLKRAEKKLESGDLFGALEDCREIEEIKPGLPDENARRLREQVLRKIENARSGDGARKKDPSPRYEEVREYFRSSEKCSYEAERYAAIGPSRVERGVARLEKARREMRLGEDIIKDGEFKKGEKEYLKGEALRVRALIDHAGDMLKKAEEVQEAGTEGKDEVRSKERLIQADKDKGHKDREERDDVTASPAQNVAEHFPGRKGRRIYLSAEFCDSVDHHDMVQYRENMFDKIRNTASGKRKMISWRGKKYIWRIRQGKYRIFYTLVNGGRDMLVLCVLQKGSREYTASALDERYPGTFDFSGILSDAVTLNEFSRNFTGSGRKTGAMKAPGSSSPGFAPEGAADEAEEVTAKIDMRAVGRLLDSLAPYGTGKSIPVENIRLYVSDTGEGGWGFAPVPGRTGTGELVYCYSRKNPSDGNLEIFFTRKFFEEHLRENINAVAEVVDHEYRENIFGLSHRAASSGSFLFAPDKGGLSPFHSFFISRLSLEEKEALAGTLVGRRGPAAEVKKLYRHNADALAGIERYEELFYAYLLVDLWLQKSAEAEDDKVLHELALRVGSFLDIYPEIRLDGKQSDIWDRLRKEKAGASIFHNARKIHAPLSSHSLGDLGGEPGVIYTGSKLGSGGDLYVKGKKRPVLRLTAHAGRRVAFSMRNGDIFRIWVLGTDGVPVEMKEMGQIRGPDGSFIRRYYFKIVKSVFSEFRDNVITGHRLDSAGVLHIGGQSANFGMRYSNCAVKIKVDNGCIKYVDIYDEYGKKIKRARFVLVFERQNILKGSFYRNISKKRQKTLDKVTLRQLKINNRGMLQVGMTGDPIPFFADHAGYEVEVDMIQGHIDRVRILSDNGKVIKEEEFKLLVDPSDESRVIASFNRQITKEDLSKLSGVIKRAKTDRYGHLRFGGKGLITSSKHRHCPVEVRIERGITLSETFFSDDTRERILEGPFEYSLVLNDKGNVIDSFRRSYSPEKRKKLRKAVVKKKKLNENGTLLFGGRYWGGFGEDHADHEVEFDVENGVVTEIRVITEEGVVPFEMSLVYRARGGAAWQLEDSFYMVYSAHKFRGLKDHVITPVRTTVKGHVDIGGRVGSGGTLSRGVFPDHPATDVTLFVKNGELVKVTDLSGEELDGVIRSSRTPAGIVRSWGTGEIVGNAGENMPRLIQALIDLSVTVSTLPERQKVLILIDTDITEMTSGDIKSSLFGIIDILCEKKRARRQLGLFLKWVEVRKGSGSELLSKTGDVPASNIILITSRTNEEVYGDLYSEGASITLFEPEREGERFPEDSYLPLTETVFFSLLKYRYARTGEFSAETLSRIYSRIPNAVPLEELSENEYHMIISPEVKRTVINLLPDARRFGSADYTRPMEIIREFLEKA